MNKNMRRLFIALAVALPLCAVASFFVYQSLSQELDDKFLGPGDSVPTRVYSRVWILRREAGMNAEEFRARLLEREYIESKNPSAPGNFSLDGAKGNFSASLTLKEFSYPPVFRAYLERQEGPLPLGVSNFSIKVADGRIAELNDKDGAINALAVEPVLIAQLSGASTTARKAVPIAEIPHTLLEAIVSVEDQRFLEHAGIDPRGIARSIWANIRAGSYVQGASTITQQLIRNIYLTHAKTLSRKLKEVAMALLLEARYSKDVILEKYLNEVYFGQSGNVAVHGVAEAASHYFNKQLGELSIAEQALLAALIRGPFFYSPYKYLDRAKQRQELVLKKMLETGIISEADYKTAVSAPLKFANIANVQDRAPYFTDMVKAQLIKDLPEQAVLGAGFTIFSTADTYYQRLADNAVSNGLLKLENTMRGVLAKKKSAPELKLLQAGFLAVEPSSSQILAMVGGRSFAESNYNRILLMKRQVGSIFKPFVYLTALIYGKDEEGQPYSAISKLEDKPFTYEYDKQSWSPRNYEGEYLGTVTLKYALAHSLNVPTAALGLRVGLPFVIEVAQKAGIQTEVPPLPSITLGSSELTPMEVATAYSTIANLGVKREMTSVLMVLDEQNEDVAHFESREEQTLPLPETANLVVLLQNVFEDGTAAIARSLGFTATASGKTGTTNDYRDSWFVGFTPKLLALSWVGYDRDDDEVKKIRKNFKLTGAIAALPIWTEFMKQAQGQSAADAPQFPTGTLRKVKIDLLSGGLATQDCSSGNNIVEELFTYNNTPRFSCPHSR